MINLKISLVGRLSWILFASGEFQHLVMLEWKPYRYGHMMVDIGGTSVYKHILVNTTLPILMLMHMNYYCDSWVMSYHAFTPQDEHIHGMNY